MRADNATKDRISERAKRIACAITIAAVLSGCSAGSKNQGDSGASKEFASKPMSAEQCAANASIQESASQDSDYRIQPGDQLALDFYMNSEFNDTATVDPNGKIVLRMVGPIQAAGLTPAQLASSIDKAYRNELRNPGAVVHLTNFAEQADLCRGRSRETGRLSASTWNDRGAGAGAGRRRDRRLSRGQHRSDPPRRVRTVARNQDRSGIGCQETRLQRRRGVDVA